jgi:TATA-box binding protein (TBP) (component of TFIID and TFIIIB)
MDNDSSIAWLRARIKADTKELADYESGKVTVGEIVGSKKIDQTQEAIADLKRKIASHEQLIAAYEKRNAKKP